MTLPTVAEQWAEFWNAVMPDGAPADQEREMRRAFYGGVHSMLCLVKQIGEPGCPENVGVLHLEMCDEELQRFKHDVLAGKAQVKVG